MSNVEQPLLTLSIAAAAALPRYRFVTVAGAVPAAGARVLGVPVTNFAAGEQAGVCARGVVLVEAGGAVSLGGQVQTDNVGRAIALDAGVAAGVALSASTAAGQLIRVLL